MNTPKWNAVLADRSDTDSIELSSMLLQHCPEVSVLAQVSNVEKTIACIQQLSPNLLFCNDILSDGTVFEVLSQLIGFHGQIVLMSAAGPSVISALRQQGFEHILKPISVEGLVHLMERLEIRTAPFTHAQASSLEGGRQEKFSNITINASGVQHFIHLFDIIHFEGDGNYTTLFLVDNRKIVVSKPLKHFEDILPAKYFFRVHQSHIINLLHIQSAQSSDLKAIRLTNGSSALLSRRKKKEFIGWLNQKLPHEKP